MEQLDKLCKDVVLRKSNCGLRICTNDTRVNTKGSFSCLAEHGSMSGRSGCKAAVCLKGCHNQSDHSEAKARNKGTTHGHAVFGVQHGAVRRLFAWIGANSKLTVVKGIPQNKVFQPPISFQLRGKSISRSSNHQSKVVTLGVGKGSKQLCRTHVLSPD